jgi:predicted dehydrogenase
LRIAIIGLGNAGYTLHLPALEGMRDHEVVGGVDLDAGMRTRSATRFKIPVFDDVETMLAQAKPDVVVVGTPPSSHATLCLRAFAAGAHVICEKPFTSTLAEAEQVITAAKAAGRGLALNHEFREMPVFRAIRDSVSSGSTGGLNFVQTWQLMDLPGWAEPGWRGQMVKRVLYEAGIHLVDMVISLFGERPIAVRATTSTCGVREGESDAVALVTLEFSRGRLGHIVQNRLSKGETLYFEVRADTDRASLRGSFGGRARVSAGLFRSTRPHVRFEYGVTGVAWKEVGAQRTQLARNPKDCGAFATRSMFEQSLIAFRDGTAPPVTGEAARDVLAVIAAVYESSSTGQRVAVDDAFIQRIRNDRLD